MRPTPVIARHRTRLTAGLTGAVLAGMVGLAACGQADRSTAAPTPTAVPVAADPPAPVVAAPAAPPPVGPVVDGPPLKLVLRSDAAAMARLQRLRGLPMPAEADQRVGLQYAIYQAAMDARAHTIALASLDAILADEAGLTAIGADDQSRAIFAGNRSVVLGKLGRYAEALTVIDAALTLPAIDRTWAQAVRCSWLWHLGRHDEATAAWAAITPPAAGADGWPVYQSCRACFAASRGDVADLRAVLPAVAASDAGREFLAHDVIFDQYRAEDWFIAVVGSTLAEAQ